MRLSALCALALIFSARVYGEVNLVGYEAMEIPVTPFSNMASGYQATNPGFRAILKSLNGEFLAGGDMTMDAVIRGYSDDASEGTAYGRLVLRMDITEAYKGLEKMEGTYRGLLSICMAKDEEAMVSDTECQNLSGNIHPERPFQWLNKEVKFTTNHGAVKITKYFGSTGEGGTSKQISLAVFHPAYGFAAPGKAFKDYQSPLVLDLNGNGKLDLVNVWNEATPVRFDLNGTGTKIRTGWVKPQDGLLFIDNGSGCVSDGRQLLGEYTGSENGKRSFDNGFLALTSVTKAKGEVKGKDLAKLRVWQDRNSDGICQKAETVAASRVIRSISLSFQTIEKPALTEDNEIRLVGSYIGKNGKKGLIGDVWFKQRRNDLVAAH